ncbi:SMI1/KNR4 family protein [Mechercharimyces sp. CAU 1602]|uniref:SMI1/KNR4 family protein n=1 Tax=Mechercharimyces sp. CAU 1602 TaxID=2973933 RepID=UPI002162D519|nr:SMI1/KNR4 family protein [Mechercharimyces sp. CAU 1602]
MEFESRLGVNLPKDFSKWLSIYGNPKKTLYGEINGEEYELDDFYSFSEIEYEVKDILDDVGGSIEGTIVPFAFDSALNQYCFFYPTENKKNPSGIFLLGSDDGPNDVFDGEKIKIELWVCTSFSEFLDAFSE